MEKYYNDFYLPNKQLPRINAKTFGDCEKLNRVIKGDFVEPTIIAKWNKIKNCCHCFFK